MTDAESLQERPIAVQIGFNKCATLSLTKLFNRSGVNSLHCNWSKGQSRREKPLYQARIHRNLTVGRPAFEGLGQFSGFFGLELVRPKRHFENFKQFQAISEAYPKAKFILNIREKGKWLRSRARHTNGVYLAKYMALYSETEEQVFARWARDFDNHHANVQAYFADKPGRLVEFDIAADNISKVTEFFAPGFQLDPVHWEHAHKTSDKSWAQQEDDRWSDFDFSRFSA